MARKNILQALAILLEKEWFRFVRESKLEVLKILQPDVNEYNGRTLDNIFFQSRQKLNQINLEIANYKSKQILGAFDLDSPNTRPLRQMINERQWLINKHLSAYRWTLDQAARELIGLKKTQEYIDAITIGRRGQDVVRELTLQSISKNFLQKSQSSLSPTYSSGETIIILNTLSGKIIF